MSATLRCHLGVGSVSEYLQDVHQGLPVLPAGDDHLEDADTGASLALPVLGVWVQSLQHVECLQYLCKVIGLKNEISVYVSNLEENCLL